LAPPALQESGGFVLSAAGHFPPQIASTYAEAYVRRVAADLQNEEGTEFDDTALKRLLDAVKKAASEVRSVVVLSQPGEKPQPVYSNEFLAVRVGSSSQFAEQAREAMRLWNSASRGAKGETKLVFDVEETKVGERNATLYSLDVASLDGGAAVPEVRQIMEQMFGPGGKLRLWIVPLDETTVLMASATPEQVAEVVKVAKQKKPIAWSEGELTEVARMLPGEADWRGFVDLHQYFEWKRRESTAMIGVPVIGGPMVRDFPSAPPVAVAGGIREGEVWADVAVLAPTLRSADTFLTRGAGRGRIQIRVQPPAGQVVPGQK
jgi:hypothetical protein